MRLLVFAILVAAVTSGCTTYYGKVVSINEADETMAVVESFSYAKEIVSLLASLPKSPSTKGESLMEGLSGEKIPEELNYTLYIELEEPGESGQEIRVGRDKTRPYSTGNVRRVIKARIEGRHILITWISGWGEKNGTQESRRSTLRLVDEITGMGKYEPVPGVVIERPGKPEPI